jgi:hypothetical protein
MGSEVEAIGQWFQQQEGPNGGKGKQHQTKQAPAHRDDGSGKGGSLVTVHLLNLRRCHCSSFVCSPTAETLENNTNEI